MPATYDKPTKEARLALLVAVLADRGPSVGPFPALTTSQIRRRLPFYGFHRNDPKEANRREMLRKDLERLTQRGLVEQIPLGSEEEASDAADGYGLDELEHPEDGSKQVHKQGEDGQRKECRVILRLPEKPEGLFLTPDEHRVLARARKVLRPDQAIPLTSPFRLSQGLDEGQTIADNAMDAAWCTVRYLEESGGEVEQDSLAADLEAAGVPNAARVARQAMSDLYNILDEIGYRPEVVTGPGIDFETKKEVPVIVRSIGLLPPRQSGSDSGGMNAFNRHAYTPDEAQERLALIEEALASGPAIGEEAKQTLRSAQYKLQRWQDLLVNVLGTA